MNITRSINGKRVKDAEAERYTIKNGHVINVLYTALDRNGEFQGSRAGKLI